ncbi:LysR family transcriptional regulator [Curvibacter sp. CHRR-16]|uniref:LysR family transcriptional regulator n=1 Tax=Curvibacter sp. CHRR-16 TaxID=2835872 RepID=UPI001BDAB044|nr:LysR family transcriptional regulator [Curvibacter sp. CHRR-16]MBT0570140.1 LysR family transcriptional regulator [Curvibacter sp. CHRR-16]
MKVKSKALLGPISDMDLRLLRVFQTVVDCGGMAAAELELNIGISTVSRHIKDLETRLGLTLCRRGRAGFALTAEGEQIYAQTRQLLAAAEAFRSGLDAIHQRMGGTLQLAIFDKTASNPASHIHEAIAAFHAAAPDVQLNLHVATLNAIERGVLDGQFDVGIIPGHRNSDMLDYLQLFDESMYLYCSKAHPLWEHAETDMDMDWDALADMGIAGLGYHSPNMELSQTRRLPRRATGFDQEAIATLILSGSFVGFLPDHYAEQFVQRGWMRALNPAVLHYRCDFFAITRRSPQPSRAARLLVECLGDTA